MLCQITSSLLVQSSWDLSAGERSKGVRPMTLQILLHRWEWKKRAIPRTPATQARLRSASLATRGAREQGCRHGFRTQVPIAEVSALLRVDLRVGVEVAHPLDVHHDQLVSRPLEGEVTEGLTDNKG